MPPSTKRITVSALARFFIFQPRSFLPGMIGKVKSMRMKTLISALLLMAGLVVLSAPAALADELKFELKANASMKEVLTELMGKRVAIRLQYGEQIEGTVTMVGNSLAHISRLSGKDFYDAVISIDRVSAVIVKAR